MTNLDNPVAVACGKTLPDTQKASTATINHAPAATLDPISVNTLDETCTDTLTTDGSPTPGYLARTLEAIKEGASFAGILRMGGAALMVFALSLFLVQGVEATSDLHRYLLLLGQTVLLTAAGFAVGFLLKEPRGARMFFSLGLISIPANFALLGAMIYSFAPLDRVLTDYPTYAKWSSANLNELLIASAAALAVLVPMCLFCFSVMARQSKAWLSAGYLLACTTLLIPVRDTLSVTVISSICALAIVALLANRRMKTERLSTGEEHFAKAFLFAPAALLLTRSAMLYDIDFYFALSLVIASYYFSRCAVTRITTHPLPGTVVQIMSASGAWILAAMLTSLVSSFSTIIDPFLMFATLLLVLNIDLVRLMKKARVSNVIHGCWAILCSCAIAVDTLILGSFSGSSTSFALAILLTAASVLTRQKLGAILGTLSIIGVVIVNGAHLFSVVLDTGWVAMALAGASTIVAGSVLERYWPVMKLYWQQRFARSVQIETTELGIESCEYQRTSKESLPLMSWETRESIAA